MAKAGKHDAATERVAIEELLARFPITGRDRTWEIRPVVRRAYSAAHRIFDQRFKGKLKVENNKSD